ncbi:MAG: Holliday junction branch migration protein RuvA [Synergistes sp.]|nr:Holliday junction branch migration protein RuvA [Synergistes sp.]
MITFLRGTVTDINNETIVIDVSGFGIELYPTKSLMTSVAIDSEMKCLTYMQISDANVAMFGFSSDVERRFFMELLQVKTIGGKMAISLMRNLDLPAIVNAIKIGNVQTLSVPGLGAKRAERICFELKQKIDKKFADLPVVQTDASSAFDSFVADALIGLGFTHGEAARSIAAAKAQADDDVVWTEETLLKASLGILQRK